MRLVVPCIGTEMRPEDERLVSIAEFLGIDCHKIALAQPAGAIIGSSNSPVADDGSCLLVNPEVIREWTGGCVPHSVAASAMTSGFQSVLIHAVRPDPFHSALIKSLTANGFEGVQLAAGSESPFNVAPDSRDVCGAFAGLSVRRPKSANDRTFSVGKGGRNFITINGEAYFAAVQVDAKSVFLLGSEDVSDLDAEVGDDWLFKSFSGFVPHAMALRYAFGEQCWRPKSSHASVIVDDPLLRESYGFLRFDRLLRLMSEHRFSTTVAFIPHNFRRSSPRAVRLFHEHKDQLSLCYHGNDHTEAEFASADPARLNTMIRNAEARIAAFGRMTELHCDRVMIFPQGKFSVQAMSALRSNNFEAAVNTVPHPWLQPLSLTLREMAQPAVQRYASFPLFLRTDCHGMQDAEIALRLFFGIPILIGEHHDIFENPESLIEAVIRINNAAPEIRWSTVGTSVRGSVLHRREAGGSLHLKAYAANAIVELPCATRERVRIHWSDSGHPAATDVRRNGISSVPFESDQSEISISVVIEPDSEENFSIYYKDEDRVYASVGLRHSVRAFLRRRLSEVRDNYISRSPRLLETARALQKRVRF